MTPPPLLQLFHPPIVSAHFEGDLRFLFSRKLHHSASNPIASHVTNSSYWRSDRSRRLKRSKTTFFYKVER